MADAVRIGSLVRDLDRAPPFHLDGVLDARLRDTLGAVAVELSLADYAEQQLMPVGRHGGPLPTDSDSPVALAFREQRVVEQPGPEDMSVFLPVSIRSERLGVLAVRLPELTADIRGSLLEVADVLGHILSAAHRYTDRFERIRRRQDMELAAEIQWDLLPVLAYDCAEYSIAGSLEPAYEIGGDTFDYAVGPDLLTMSVTDAMGHGLRAALMASLAVTSMRNVRRRGAGPLDQVRAAAKHVTEQFGEPGFVAGLVIEADVPGGTGRVINAGHLPPLLLRDGEVTEIPLHPDTPLGMFPDTEFELQPIRFRPGDRLLLYTDGISEATTGGEKERFGEDGVRAWLTDSAGSAPVEVVRSLTSYVVQHCVGPLADDATAVCLDWRGSARANPTG